MVVVGGGCTGQRPIQLLFQMLAGANDYICGYDLSPNVYITLGMKELSKRSVLSPTYI